MATKYRIDVHAEIDKKQHEWQLSVYFCVATFAFIALSFYSERAIQIKAEW